jgi:hypothetical protein
MMEYFVVARASCKPEETIQGKARLNAQIGWMAGRAKEAKLSHDVDKPNDFTLISRWESRSEADEALRTLSGLEQDGSGWSPKITELLLLVLAVD